MAATLQLLDDFAIDARDPSAELPLMAQRLVAFVALRGRSRRCQVAGTLWPDVAESQALASLRTSVWRVKRTVPGMIRSDAVVISLDPDVVVDSREQESFAMSLLNGRGDDPQWVRSGLSALERVELLPGWYDDWVIFERERMSQLRLHALERAARIFTRDRELDTALELALEAVRAEPLRESAHAVLMAVYIEEGNVWDAVHQYDVFSELLWRELGLVPSKELARMLPPEVRHPGED